MADRDAYEPPQAELERPAPDASRAVIEGKVAPHVRVLLVAILPGLFLLWFVYDGWIASAPAIAEHQTFNRVMAAFTSFLVAIPIAIAGRVRRAVEQRRSNRSTLLLLSPRGDRIQVATAPWLWSILFGGLNLISHRRPWLGVLCWIGSQLTAGLGGIVLSFFARGVIEREYEAAGWRTL